MTTTLLAHTTKPKVPSDDEDLPTLIAALVPELRRRAQAMTGSASDAGDLVQDTIERAIRSLARFQSGTNLRVWVLTIMKNLFFDQCRSIRVRRSATQPLRDVDDAAAPVTDEECDEVPTWGQVSAEQFQTAVGKLDPLLHEVFRLRVAERLAYQAISLRLGIPVATVGTRLNRARIRIRGLLLDSLGSPNTASISREGEA